MPGRSSGGSASVRRALRRSMKRQRVRGRDDAERAGNEEQARRRRAEVGQRDRACRGGPASVTRGKCRHADGNSVLTELPVDRAQPTFVRIEKRTGPVGFGGQDGRSAAAELAASVAAVVWAPNRNEGRSLLRPCGSAGMCHPAVQHAPCGDSDRRCVPINRQDGDIRASPAPELSSVRLQNCSSACRWHIRVVGGK